MLLNYGILKNELLIPTLSDQYNMRRFDVILTHTATKNIGTKGSIRPNF